MNDVSRRRFLAAGVTGVALAAMEGCTDLGGESETSLGLPLPPIDVDDLAWAHVRERFILESEIAYMNNASLGMPPHMVAKAVCDGYEAISREPLHGKHDLQEIIAEQVVPGLAAYFGVDEGEMSLTRNATEALHLQAMGLILKPGDEVLVTSQEHPAGNSPWMLRAERHGIRVSEVFIPSPFDSGEQVVDLMESAITPRTRALSFCHVTRGGHLYPVKEISEMAHRHGLLSLVDGAQAVGQFSVDLHDLACDAYSASLHKWVLGPAGTGFMYVREVARDVIRTNFSAGATVESPGLAPGGTADFPVRAALATALDFCNALGANQVEHRCRYLSNHLKSGLTQIDGVTILSGPTPETSCPGSTIFEKEGLDAVRAVGLFEERIGTHIDEHQRDGHNAIRVSTHVYNTTAEIDRFLEELSTARA